LEDFVDKVEVTTTTIPPKEKKEETRGGPRKPQETKVDSEKEKESMADGSGGENDTGVE